MNSSAIEPGKHWLGNLVVSEGDVLLVTQQTRRYIPYIEFSYATSLRLTDTQKAQIEAATQRAFKVWTRHIEMDLRTSQPPFYGTFQVNVGSTRCGINAVACAREATALRNGSIYIPRDTAIAMAGGVSVAMFATLAHEVGHALGYDDNVRQTGIQGHADEGSGQLMTPVKGQSESIVPSLDDLRGLRRTYFFSEDPAGHDAFGWWGIANPSLSNLFLFGVKVNRTLSVDDDFGGISSLLDGVAVDAITNDSVQIGAFVDGVPTAASTVRAVTGTASYSGILLGASQYASDGYAPVSGTATLRANFTTESLSASFTNLRVWEGGTPAAIPGLSSLSYDLGPVDGSEVWADTAGRIDARFFATRATAISTPDATGAVAGRLHDERSRVAITGAFGAEKD